MDDLARRKDLIDLVDELRPERDALTTGSEQAEASFHEVAARCLVPGIGPWAEADRWQATLSEYQVRLGAIVGRMADGEEEIAVLTARIDAPKLMEAAVKALQAQRQISASVEKKIIGNARMVEQLLSKEVAERDAEHAAQEALVAYALGTLGQVDREQIGAAAVEQGTPVADPTQHAVRAQAFADAARRQVAAGEGLARELQASQAAEQAAVQAVLVARCHAAEAAHALAIAKYMPQLVAFVAAHEAAHSWSPGLPDFMRHVREGQGAAVAAARAAATADPEGLLKRGIKRLAGVAGF